MPNKISVPLQSLISCFIEYPVKRWVAVGATEGWWQGLLFSGSQSLHYLLGPSSCYPSRWGVLLSLIFFLPMIRPMKTVSTVQAFSRFSGRLWRGFLSTFSPMLFLLSFSSSLPGLEPSQNLRGLASGPNEVQAPMSHCKNSVRDMGIGKR